MIKAGMKTWMSYAFLAGVRAGGPEGFGFTFSWGFARKNKLSGKGDGH